MKATFYGIGVGPGDPDLVTIKAKKIVNGVDILFTPTKQEGAASFAHQIIAPHIDNPDLTIVELVYPMQYDWQTIEQKWQENANAITAALQSGKDCAFITLGDPTVYSTFIYTLQKMDRQHFDLEIVPGITSFCATAARLGQPLTAWEESLKIVPVRKNDSAHLRAQIERADNLVLMKPARDASTIVRALRELGLEDKFALISKVGTPEESIIYDIDQLSATKLPYLSTMIIKKGGFDA